MKLVQNLLTVSIFVLVGIVATQAQEDKSKRVSPPKTATASMGELTLTIDYSAPSVKGREIWGALVPYGKVWRTGANEATTLEVNQDVLIQGQELKTGKYALFTIPNEDSWTFVFNSVSDQWGAYGYDEEKDVLRIDSEPMMQEDHVEMLTFEISGEETKGQVSFIWENLMVGFSIEPKSAN